MKVTIQFQIGF